MVFNRHEHCSQKSYEINNMDHKQCSLSLMVNYGTIDLASKSDTNELVKQYNFAKMETKKFIKWTKDLILFSFIIFTYHLICNLCSLWANLISTWGQFGPPSIVVACVSLCVRPCVNSLLARAITCDPLKPVLASAKLSAKSFLLKAFY